MKASTLHMTGTSLGSYGTSLVFPDLKIAFDMGRTTERAVHADVVCLTHGHMDHIGGVGHHCARRELLGLTPPTYIMGPDLVEPFAALMQAYRALDGSTLNYNVFILRPGERMPLPRRNFHVEAFQATHVIPTQGYAIVESKRKLRPELAGVSGREIALRANAGEEVNVTVETYRVAYTGDTRIDVLEQEAVQKAECLIIDCTFLDDLVSPDKAHRTWHIHLDHLIENAHRLRNQSILLTHFSMRYSKSSAKKAIRSRLPDDRLGSVPVRWLQEPFNV